MVAQDHIVKTRSTTEYVSWNDGDIWTPCIRSTNVSSPFAYLPLSELMNEGEMIQCICRLCNKLIMYIFTYITITYI